MAPPIERRHRGVPPRPVGNDAQGRRAQEFIDDIETGDDQELMARLTGNYKRGNERHARQHPRNRARR